MTVKKMPAAGKSTKPAARGSGHAPAAHHTSHTTHAVGPHPRDSRGHRVTVSETFFGGKHVAGKTGVITGSSGHRQAPFTRVNVKFDDGTTAIGADPKHLGWRGEPRDERGRWMK